MRQWLALLLLVSSVALAQRPAVITDPKQIISPRQDALQTPSLERLLMTRTIGGSAWSPDGKQIAFVSNISGRDNLWLISAEGGWPTQLTVSDRRQHDPVWSPSGKFIAYTSDQEGSEQQDIFIVSPFSGEVTNLTQSPAISEREPAWSPNSRYMAWTARSGNGPSEIEVFDMLLRRRRALTQHTPKGLDNIYPIWSKDGRWIAYTQVRSDGKDSSIWMVEVATGKATNLTPHQGDRQYLASDWSPDGKQLLITSTALNGHPNVALLQIATRKLDWLTWETQDAHAGAFSPDGKLITFTSNKAGDTKLFLYHTDSKETEVLSSMRTKAPGQALPAGDFVSKFAGASAFSSDSSRLLYYREAASVPRELWLYTLATRQSQQLTHALMAGVRVQDMVAPSRVVYPGGNEKSQVSAFVYAPYNQIKNGQAPAIVYLRRPAPFANGFDPGLQFLLNQGYFVIAPDISTPGFDANDVVAAAKWIGQNAYINPKKSTVMGEGYGGYLALAALAKAPQTWAAGVLLTPSLNSPAADAPLNLAGIKAPLLIAAGANDPRSPQFAVQQLADSIRKNGGRVQLKTYTQEGHGFARVEDEIDAWQRIAAFLKFHVPAPGCGCSLE